MIPSLLAASAAAARERAVLDAFDAARAGTPAHAVPLSALRPLDRDVLATLLDRGAVREGAPGTFFRYVPAASGAAARPKQQRLILLVLIALLVVGAILVGRLLRAS